jgi:hypothetical protein
MFCLLFGILFFPFILPFLIIRFVFMALAGVVLAVFSPLIPFAFVALVVWALTRHSRAASVIPG